MSTPVLREDKIYIAFVINDLLYGGAQIVLHAIATKLAREKFVVTVYYLNEYGPERKNRRDDFIRSGVRVVYVGSGGKTNMLPAAVRLARFWYQDRPDIVHAHLPHAVLATLLAKTVSPKLRVVVHEHQTHSRFSWKIRLLYKILRPFSRLAISYAETVERENFGTSQLLGEPPTSLNRRSYTIRNGVHIDMVMSEQTVESRARYRKELGCDTDTVLIMSVGRFIDWKGQHNLVEAFLLAAPQNHNLKLCLIGDGPMRAELIERVEGTSFRDHIIFTGDRPDVYGLLGAADIFSLVYTYPPDRIGEALGVAGYEALASGLPLIAGIDQPLIAGLDDGKNLMLVDATNSLALGKALILLASNPELRREIGNNAKLFAECNLAWSHLVTIYEKIYQLLVRP